MSSAEPLVPLWIQRSDNNAFSRMPERPVLITVDLLGSVLHGQVLDLQRCTAQILPSEPFLLWSNVRISIRFRFKDMVYTLAGTATTNEGDKSFCLNFDSVTRKSMATLFGQLKESGCLREAEANAPEPCDEPSHDSSLLDEAESLVQRLPAPDGKERRNHERHSLVAEATVQKIDTNKILKCQVLDVSEGGCRIHREYPSDFAEGDLVEVQFAWGGFPFRLKSRVQFVNEEHVAGLEFLNMSSRTAARLTEIITELSEDAKSSV